MSDMIPPRSSPIPAEIYGTSKGLFYLLGVRPDAETTPLPARQAPTPGPETAPSGPALPAATAILAQVQMADMFCFRG
jgi:hypothetical protein